MSDGKKAGRNKVKFKILQGGSDIGVADVARGRVTLGMSSRIPKPCTEEALPTSRMASVMAAKASGLRGDVAL